MSKMSELDLTLNAIIESGEKMVASYKAAAEAGELILASIKGLKDLFISSTPAVPEEKTETASVKDKEEPKKEEVKTYTFDQVREYLSDLSGKGKFQDVKALLIKYGVKRLSDIKPEDYPALMKEAEEIANA